jgi:lipopolysaccharide/colanic/teichoic acid biosynthesis glycosyltransferase
MKRTFDFVISFFLLFVLSPIFLILVVLIKTRLGSPVLFKQIRPGLNSKPFVMIKFRSMLDSSDRFGNPLPDSDRLTNFGRLLRSTSLDELPGLFNVLKGEMSLVGPRPLLMEYLPLYTEEQLKRHEVRPGITGWAQVNGRNAISWEDKFELDTWYVENQSIWLDIRVLILTVKKVFMREGISAEGEATISKFTGSKKN